MDVDHRVVAVPGAVSCENDLLREFCPEILVVWIMAWIDGNGQLVAAPPFAAYAVDLAFLFSPLPLTIWLGSTVEVHERQLRVSVADNPYPVEGWVGEVVAQLGHALRESVSHMIAVLYLPVVADRSATVKLISDNI